MSIHSLLGDLCDACGINLQLGNISRVQTRLGSKTETNLRRSSWKTIEPFQGLGIGSWSPKLGEWVHHLYANHKQHIESPNDKKGYTHYDHLTAF